VWRKLAALMSSKESMLKHARQWMKDRQQKSRRPAIDKDVTEKEIAKLREQESRYMKAYGAGIYSIEELQTYVLPIKEKVALLEKAVGEARANSDGEGMATPSEREIESFANASAKDLHGDLSFDEKRVIVLETIDSVIGTTKELQVRGVIPVSNYVEFKTSDRHCGSTQRRQIDAF
jgi:site-specific DNA recombinase